VASNEMRKTQGILECGNFVYVYLQTKLQWLQNTSETNGDNLQNLIRETSRTFRKWKREYLKGEIYELETNAENKNIRELYRGTNEFKEVYQNIINIIKEENGNLLPDPNSDKRTWGS
jgi:hypothetical protein